MRRGDISENQSSKERRKGVYAQLATSAGAFLRRMATAGQPTICGDFKG
jgi:hypothetical protein